MPGVACECRDFAERVKRGEARLIGSDVIVAPPNPLRRPDGSLLQRLIED